MGCHVINYTRKRRHLRGSLKISSFIPRRTIFFIYIKYDWLEWSRLVCQILNLFACVDFGTNGKLNSFHKLFQGPLAIVSSGFVAAYYWDKQGWAVNKNPVSNTFRILWIFFEPILFAFTGAQITVSDK